MEIKVNIKQPFTAFVYQAKEALREKDAVALHALGEATSSAIKASEMMVSLGYATMERFETLTVSEPDRQGVARRRYKVIIELKKSHNFQQLYEDFNKSRAAK